MNVWYVVTPSKNPAVTDLLRPLRVLLKTEWDLWSTKRPSSTIKALTKCHIALDILSCYIEEDNWTAALLSLTKFPLTVEDLDKSFRNKPDLKNQARQFYKTAMLVVIEYLMAKNNALDGTAKPNATTNINSVNSGGEGDEGDSGESGESGVTKKPKIE